MKFILNNKHQLYVFVSSITKNQVNKQQNSQTEDGHIKIQPKAE